VSSFGRNDGFLVGVEGLGKGNGKGEMGVSSRFDFAQGQNDNYFLW
jgi:hypothetical protein